MKPAATAALVTAAALLAPASALATSRTTAPFAASAVAQLAGSTTTSPSSTSTDQTGATLDLGPVTPTNIDSARTALNAYATYLQTLVKDASESQASDSEFVSEVSGADGCKSALEPLTQSGQQVSNAVQTTLTAVGEEIGDDLAINFNVTALEPFTKLTQTLGRLRWSRPGRDAAIVKRYATAQTEMLEFQPSALCADVLAAAAPQTAPQTEPAATKLFLKQYDEVADAANVALSDFLELLRDYQTPAEQKLVTRITTLAAQVSKMSKADLVASGQALTTALETT